MANNIATGALSRTRGSPAGRVVQRHVLYLGEINDSQELAWRRSIEVLEDGAARPRTLSLFPEDRVQGLLADASIVGVRLSELRLRRPRQWGACWLALMLWRELQLDQFGSKRLGVSRKGTPWDQVLLVLVANRLPAPGSEWRLHREWFQRSALADLLGEDAGPSTSSGGRDPQAVPLSRPAAGAQTGGVRSPDGAVARPVQHQLRRAAVRSDEYPGLRRGSSISRRTRRFGKATSAATGTRAITGRIVCRSSLRWW